MKRLFKRLLRIGVEYGALALSIVVPKQRGLVVFSMSRGRCSGNSRVLFEYLVVNAGETLDPRWLSDPKLSKTAIPDWCKDRFLPRHSLQGWLTIAKADIVIISHSFGDFGILRKIAKRKKVVMLWHAITTKYCGLLDEKFSGIQKKKYVRLETKHYDMLIASSDIDLYYSASYTGMDVNSIIVTGLPRNDRLFGHEGLRKKEEKKVSILYAPTFRDYPVNGESLLFPFCEDMNVIADWARNNDIQFLLRPHPNDTGSVAHVQLLASNNPDVFLDAGVMRAPEVMDLIIKCDGIITDYSSVYVDGLALDRPVTFVDHDRELYMEKRGLAYDYDLITPGPKVQSWPDFQCACEEMVRGAEAWGEHREFVRKIFFKYRDSGACARVTALIEGMVGQ